MPEQQASGIDTRLPARGFQAGPSGNTHYRPTPTACPKATYYRITVIEQHQATKDHH